MKIKKKKPVRDEGKKLTQKDLKDVQGGVRKKTKTTKKKATKRKTTTY